MTAVTPILVPDNPSELAALEAQGNTIAEQVAPLLKLDPKSAPEAAFQRVAEAMKLARDFVDEVEALIGPRIAQAHRLHKDLCADRKRLAGPHEETAKLCARWLADWKLAEERKLAEIAAKAQAEAAKIEEEARLQQAVALEAAGEAEAAADMLDAPLPLPPPPMQMKAKAEGVGTREIWKAEVTSIKELCRAIGAGEVPEHYVTPNMPPLNQLAKAQRGAMRVPGVRAVRDLGIARR